MMKKVLVIENTLPEFNAIKEGLEPVYQVIPKENFEIGLFNNDNSKALFEQIDSLLNEHKENLAGIILDANLKDHRGAIEDMTGIEDILPAIRGKGGLFSIIPIIIFTKFDESKGEAFNNLANYYVKKQKDLKVQTKTEIRWILSSLGSIYEISRKKLKQAYTVGIRDISRDINEKLNLLPELTRNIDEIKDIFSELLLRIYDEINNMDKKMEIIAYYILSLLPEKKRFEVIDETIKELESTGTSFIKEKLQQLKSQNKWEDFKNKLKKLALKEILPALVEEFGIYGLKLLLRTGYQFLIN